MFIARCAAGSYKNRRGGEMIRQPKEDRGHNDRFLAAEKRRIEVLNEKFFNNVELTEDEQRYLVWVCGWDEDTLKYIISAFEKAVEKGK